MQLTNLMTNLSERSRALEASKIREIAELGMKQEEVIPLWFGEGAWPTNTMIVEAAIEALRNGNHKYTPNNGIPALRSAIADYSNNLFGSQLTSECITVTPSGMQGLMLAAEILITPGDRIVVLEPGWPNISGAFAAQGAEVTRVSIEPRSGKWQLDIGALLEALHPKTKVLVINSPNNPTGWTMSSEEQGTILSHCRKYGIWIVSDDVYARLYRHGNCAPSFLSIAEPDDQILSINSFSKCWSMTGWRLGWIAAPAELELKLGQLTEFNTCCTPGFVQQAGVVALQQGEHEIADLMQRIKVGYDIAASRLQSYPQVEFIEPDGAFYCFFRVDGLNDSLAAAKQVMADAKVGVAPGIAFGPSGEGYLRICYAQPAQVLVEAFDRLDSYFKTSL